MSGDILDGDSGSANRNASVVDDYTFNNSGTQGPQIYHDVARSRSSPAGLNMGKQHALPIEILQKNTLAICRIATLFAAIVKASYSICNAKHTLEGYTNAEIVRKRG